MVNQNDLCYTGNLKLTIELEELYSDLRSEIFRKLVTANGVQLNFNYQSGNVIVNEPSTTQAGFCG